MSLKKITLLFVALMSFQILAKESKSSDKSRFEQLELFNKVLHLVETQYYRDVDTEKLIEGAIKGMLETLDPHSAFLNEKYFTKMQNDTSGEFGGLGIEVTQKNGVLYVVTSIDDTPAFKAGILPKDKIVEIDHESTQGWTLEQAIEKLRGEIGEKIHLGILRKGSKSVKNFELKRQLIKVKPVKYELLNEEFAYIRLSQFQKNSASSIESALKELSQKAKKNSGLHGIIIDLRSNPGGLLDQAVDVSSLFLKEGIVVSTEAKDPTNKEIRYVKKTGYKNLNTPVVVLVNGASASASEIVAGALQDHKRALIMGSQTFGKGSVQTVAQIDEKNGLKLTIAQYMTPKGRKIQAIGIVPDIALTDVTTEWAEKVKKEDNFLREKDLKNHLTATIETEEEKQKRLIEEKHERELRIKKINKASNKKQKKEDEIFKVYTPMDDYQVVQAVNLLKSLDVINNFSHDKK
jgi:carboxyl-terminal processing protease